MWKTLLVGVKLRNKTKTKQWVSINANDLCRLTGKQFKLSPRGGIKLLKLAGKIVMENLQLLYVRLYTVPLTLSSCGFGGVDGAVGAVANCSEDNEELLVLKKKNNDRQDKDLNQI